jgi:hypothetical protein
MRTYRIYNLDASGRIERAKYVDASDDAEALTIAQAETGSQASEVWLDERMVGVVNQLTEGS